MMWKSRTDGPVTVMVEQGLHSRRGKECLERLTIPLRGLCARKAD